MATRQTDINEKMRAILVDWLIDVHLKFKLLPETLFLTINLIDRYLEQVDVNRVKLQLVGVTAMLIACKFEEVQWPYVRDFVYITDKAYSREEIIKMEYSMLLVLDYNICAPSSFRFLERYAKVVNANMFQFNFARYCIELPLIEYRMLKYSPSTQAVSAVYLAMGLAFEEADGDQKEAGSSSSNWAEQLFHYSGYTEDVI